MQLVKIIPILLSLFGCTSFTLCAAESGLIDGNSGSMLVHGMLTENACRLEMNSEWQDVDLGIIETRMLQFPGDRAHVVDVGMRFKDCVRVESRKQNPLTQTLVWSAYQPAVAATILAPADLDNPDLVQVIGTKGLALRIIDDTGRTILPGVTQGPQLLSPGQDALSFHIVPERTNAALDAGYFYARLDVRLSYD
ncbi:TPA: fimbrial protein [Citrobacter koseri]